MEFHKFRRIVTAMALATAAWGLQPAAHAVLDDYPATDGADQNAQAGKANAYAFDITIDKSTPSAPKVRYRLNASCAAVTVSLFLDDHLIAQKPGSTVSPATVTFDGIYAKGHMRAEVKVETGGWANTTNVPQLVNYTADGNVAHINNGSIPFVEPYSVTINTCTDSPTFGAIVMTEGGWNMGGETNNSYYSTSSSSRYSGATNSNLNIMYAFNPMMHGFTNAGLNHQKYGYTAALDYFSPAARSDNNSTYLRFHRLRYSADGRLFVLGSQYDTGGSEHARGLYKLNSQSINGLNDKAQPVYARDQDLAGGELIVNGAIYGVSGAGLSLWGKGDQTKIAVSSSGNTTVGITNATRLSVFNLGSADRLTGPAYNSNCTINGMSGFHETRTAQVAWDKDGKGLMQTGYALASPTDNPGGLHWKDDIQTCNYNDRNDYSQHGQTERLFNGCAAIIYNKDYTLAAVGHVWGRPAPRRDLHLQSHMARQRRHAHVHRPPALGSWICSRHK